jgi:hypothetical protein
MILLVKGGSAGSQWVKMECHLFLLIGVAKLFTPQEE